MSLEKLLNEPTATVIDVREPWEFEMGHVEGSVNIPLGTVPNKVAELKSMSKPLILCCASGNRSGQATMFLNGSGIADAYNGGSWMTVNSAKMAVQ